MTTARTKIAAAALGTAFAFTTVAPAAAAPSYPPSEPTALRCNLKPIKSKSQLKLNVNPNLPGAKNYRFRLYKLVDGNWVLKRKFATQGKAETRVMNRRKGQYKIKCYGTKYGYLNAWSSVVMLKK